MGIAAAVAGSAALGLVGSVLTSSASSSAASQQAAAANQSAELQNQEFNQTQANLSPYSGAGNQAQSVLLQSLGLEAPGTGGYGYNALEANGVARTFTPVGGATFQPTQAQLASTPGYQFDLNQGLQAVQNSNAAQGQGISGAALKGAASYATGLANNTLTTQQGIFQQNLQNQQGIYNQNFANIINPLQNAASLGENAAATAGNQGVQSTANIGNTLVGGANASAAGTVGSANAIAGGLGSAGSSPLNYLLYNQLLGGNSGASNGLSGPTTLYPAGGSASDADAALGYPA